MAWGKKLLLSLSVLGFHALELFCFHALELSEIQMCGVKSTSRAKAVEKRH